MKPTKIALMDLQSAYKDMSDAYCARGDQLAELEARFSELEARANAHLHASVKWRLLAEAKSAATVEPLSPVVRRVVERWAGSEPHQHSFPECDAKLLAVELDKRFPAPSPVAKPARTPEQLLRAVLVSVGETLPSDAKYALSELVALAKGGGK